MAGFAPPIVYMSDMRNLGVKIDLDIEREMVFNLIVQDACIERFRKIDDLFKSLDDEENIIWMAVQMINEGAEIYNEYHQDNKITLVDEKKVRRYTSGIGGKRNLYTKVNEAILKGLPEEAVQKVVELGEQMAAQRQTQNGVTMNRSQKRAKEK